jgi:hypothetical protein
VTPVRRLTRQNATGNGAPSVDDLVKAQTAILLSNANVLGAVNQMQTDIGGRLDRQFGDVAQSLTVVEVKVDGLDTRLGCIEEARRTDAALAVQAKSTAAERNAEAKDAAVEAKGTAADNNADRQAHTMSRNQRWAIVVAAISGVGGLALGLVTLLLRAVGVLHA